MIKRKCLNCGKIFYTYPCRLGGNYGHFAKYCSKRCANKISFKVWNEAGKKHRYKKGHIPFSKLHPEIVLRGIKHRNWKGENVGYRGLHYWLRRIKGIPIKCSQCGVIRTTPKSIHWANIDHKYYRNPNDYISLCKSCHKIYDLSHQ